MLLLSYFYTCPRTLVLLMRLLILLTLIIHGRWAIGAGYSERDAQPSLPVPARKPCGFQDHIVPQNSDLQPAAADLPGRPPGVPARASLCGSLVPPPPDLQLSSHVMLGTSILIIC